MNDLTAPAEMGDSWVPTGEFLFLSKIFCLLINFSRALCTRNRTGIAESEVWKRCECVRDTEGHDPLAPCRDMLCRSHPAPRRREHGTHEMPRDCCTPSSTRGMVGGMSWHWQGGLLSGHVPIAAHKSSASGLRRASQPPPEAEALLSLRGEPHRSLMLLLSLLAGWKSRVSCGKLLWGMTGRAGVRYVIK